MNLAKLSQKYQIVIPTAVRVKMRLSAGTRLAVYPLDRERALLVRHPHDYVTALQGMGKDVWKSLGGAKKYIKQERKAWGNR